MVVVTNKYRLSSWAVSQQITVSALDTSSMDSNDVLNMINQESCK